MGSEKALSASGQAGASRISRVSLGSLEASLGKPGDGNVRARGGGRGLPWLVWVHGYSPRL